MLTLYTTNPKKYAPFQALLSQMGIVLEVPGFEMPEPQHHDFAWVLAEKARSAAQATGHPSLVDDSGLLLDAYPGFPGPLTKYVCECLGAAGFERLLGGASRRGRLQCHLGCWRDGRLWHWQGEVAGRWTRVGQRWMDLGCLRHGSFRRKIQWPMAFSPIGGGLWKPWLATWTDSGRAFRPRPAGPIQTARSQHRTLHVHSVPSLLMTRLPSSASSPGRALQTGSSTGRLISLHFPRSDSSSKVACSYAPGRTFSPAGISRMRITTNWRSWWSRLQSFFVAITAATLSFSSTAPRSAADKGTCCVDHAHLNVFPVVVDVYRHLQTLPHTRIRHFRDLGGLGRRGQPYLFLQTNAGQRFAYEVEVVPSQHIRKIITAELGMADRWHWREYLGLEELKRTMSVLSGWR